MYEIRLDPAPGFLYYSGTGKVYASITCKIILNYFQYVPGPPPEDIVTIGNASGGLDITVDLRVIGAESNTSTLGHGTFLVPLFTANTGLSLAQVKTAIGDKVFNLTVNTNFGGVPQKQATGTITNSSDIDIE
ncbi:MAG TPA: hypothetical protein VK994_03170 [Bacteroidales bacterium]|nr:hypothetical protein [Bacteroidales bacterium]